MDGLSSDDLATINVIGNSTNIVDGVIKVVVDVENIIPLFWKASRHILATGLKSSVIGAAAGLIAGLKDAPEKPITSTQFECTTLEEYEKVLESEVQQRAVDPKYKDALMMIAATFIEADENGNKYWDCEGYKNFLNKAAGNGGILNREELIGALGELENTEEPEDKPVEENEQEVQEEEPDVPEDKCPVNQYNNPVDTTLTHKIKFGDSWEEIVKAYFPSWKDCFGKMYGKNGAIQALKKALATTSDGTVDNSLYQKLLAGYIPSSIKIPEKLNDCVRDDNGQVKFKKPEGTPKGYIGSVGISSGYNEIVLSDCNNQTGTGKTVDEALDDLNKKTGKNYTKEDIVK